MLPDIQNIIVHPQWEIEQTKEKAVPVPELGVGMIKGISKYTRAQLELYQQED